MNEAIPLFAFIAGVALGLSFGLLQGEKGKVAMLKNMLNHGSTDPVKQGHTIMPDTAESRIDVSAKMVEDQYEQETINTGVDHLAALCVSEGREVPSRKELEKEVREMLGRSGTSEAGVNV